MTTITGRVEAGKTRIRKADGTYAIVEAAVVQVATFAGRAVHSCVAVCQSATNTRSAQARGHSG